MTSMASSTKASARCGLFVWEPGREGRKGDREHCVDAGGTGDAHRFVDGRDRGVERRFCGLDRACEHEERGCELVRVPGRPGELDPFLSVTSRLFEVVDEEREGRLSPHYGRKP